MSQQNYPICNIWMDWRTQTDKNMQSTFCPVAQATDTNPVVWDYPDPMGGPRGYPVDNRWKRSEEGFCNSCTRTYTSRALGTRYNYQ